MVWELAKTAAKRRQIGRLVQDAVAAVQTAAAATNNRSEEAKKNASAPLVQPPLSQPVEQHIFASSDVRYKDGNLQGYIAIPGMSFLSFF